VSRAQIRIREAVTRNRQDKLTALLHHVNIDVLRASFFELNHWARHGALSAETELGMALIRDHSFRRAPQTDCVAEHVGFELRCAERKIISLTSRPNSDLRDTSADDRGPLGE
jgi:hypothetical protein